MEFGNVVDQLHDHNSLAYTCTTKRTDFTALQEGADQINDLDTGSQNFGSCGLIDQSRSGTMDRIIFVSLEWTSIVHWLSGHVENASHDSVTDGHRDGSAGVLNIKAAFQTFSRRHSHCTHPVISEMLLDFQSELAVLTLNFVVNGQRIVNSR